MQTKLDLLRPDVESTVSGHQGCQKSSHDKHAKGREFRVGQAVMVRNLRKGPKWVAGVISERKGPLTFLVEVEPNQYWRRHVDHIRDRSDSCVRESMEEGITDRKAEGFLEEETETDAGMMEDLEHPVQQETEMALEAAEPEDHNTGTATEQKAEDSELPEVAVQQPDVQNTNIQTPELNTRRYPQRIRRPPDHY